MVVTHCLLPEPLQAATHARQADLLTAEVASLREDKKHWLVVEEQLRKNTERLMRSVLCCIPLFQ